MMGEGRDGGGCLGPCPPPPESSPTVGGGSDFWLNWGSKLFQALFDEAISCQIFWGSTDNIPLS
jgi:hypothetical protein